MTFIFEKQRRPAAGTETCKSRWGARSSVSPVAAIGFWLGLMMAVAQVPAAFAAPASYAFDPQGSVIGGSVSYTVLGRYHCVFEKYEGTLMFNPEDLAHSSVVLEIDVASVKSRFPGLDKAVRSGRLLDAATHPKIVFQSTQIAKTGKAGEYRVKGMLTMHGITRERAFLFHLEETLRNGRRGISASGRWDINRKDFGIVWSDVLDKGGLIVGDIVTVEWNVTARPPGRTSL